MVSRFGRPWNVAYAHQIQGADNELDFHSLKLAISTGYISAGARSMSFRIYLSERQQRSRIADLADGFGIFVVVEECCML